MHLSRRTFLKGSLAAGALVAAGAGVGEALGARSEAAADPPAPAWLNGLPLPVPTALDPEVTVVPSVCGLCPAGCALRARIWNGYVVKLDGNPYAPTGLEHPLARAVEPLAARRYGGSLCAKGQAGRQHLYAAAVVTSPLKRQGSRGSGRWERISWEQALRELSEGGDLFGEGAVAGLRELRDLKTPIDPGAPELGPRVNQVIFYSQPEVGGRAEFLERFARDAYGSVNITVPRLNGDEGRRLALGLTFPGGGDFAPDLGNLQLLVYFGAAPLETGALPIASRRLLGRLYPSGGGSEVLQKLPGATDAAGLAERPTLVVVDPRYSQTAAKADRWLPIQPGGDAALALGLARYLVDNNLYDTDFLRRPSVLGARDGVYTDATYLVGESDGQLLHAEDLGLGTADDYVVAVGGIPQAASTVAQADLEWRGSLNGQAVRTVFSSWVDAIRQREVDDWARAAGLSPTALRELAQAFGAAGSRAVAEFGGGLTAGPAGVAAARAVLFLNLLAGNLNRSGGYGPGGSFDYLGEETGAPYPLAQLHPGRVTATGVRLDRAGATYEDSTEYRRQGYPARRAWFPLAAMSSVELFAGLAAGYPYPAKALLISGANPVYELPGGPETIAATLRDRSRVPLLAVIDRDYTETAALADYILPDVSYLEQYGLAPAPAVLRAKGTGFRQPVLSDRLYPESRSLEEVLLALATRLGLPGFGPGGFGPGLDLNVPWDYYQLLLQNLAQGLSGLDPVGEIQSHGGRWEEGLTRYQGLARFYPEELLTVRDSQTGKTLPIWPVSAPPVTDHFTLVTYQLPFQYRGKTIQDPYLVEPWPQNQLLMNPADGQRLGLGSGDRVRVSSDTGRLTVPVLLRPGLRPGVVALSEHFGHWEYGARPLRIRGESPAAPATYRAAGVAPERLLPLRADPLSGASRRQGVPCQVVKI